MYSICICVKDDGLFQCKGKTWLMCTEQVLAYIGRPLADFPQDVGGFTTADGSGFPGRNRAPPRLGRSGLSRGAVAEAARFCELQLVADEEQASKSAMQTTGKQRYPSSGVGCHKPQWLPVWPGLSSRKLRWTLARGRREEVRSWWAARLCELQLVAEEVQAGKSAVWTAGKQRYPGSVGGHRPAMAACMARLNVTEAPLDGSKGPQGRGTKPAGCQASWASAGSRRGAGKYCHADCGQTTIPKQWFNIAEAPWRSQRSAGCRWVAAVEEPM